MSNKLEENEPCVVAAREGLQKIVHQGRVDDGIKRIGEGRRGKNVRRVRKNVTDYGMERSKERSRRNVRCLQARPRKRNETRRNDHDLLSLLGHERRRPLHSPTSPSAFW